jgi:hypothetical protein
MNLNEIKVNVSFLDLKEILVKKGLQNVYDLCQFSELDDKNAVFKRADKLIHFLSDVLGFDFVAAFGLNPLLRCAGHCTNDYASNENGIAFTFRSYPAKVKLDELFGGKDGN